MNTTRNVRFACKGIFAACALALPALLVAGCPGTGTPGGNDNLPSGDPGDGGGTVTPQNLSAFIQLRAGGTRLTLSGGNTSATLFCVVSNASALNVAFAWTIDREGGGTPILEFRDNNSSVQTLSATGNPVVVVPTADDSADHNVNVVATVTDSDGDVVATLSDRVLISVAPTTQTGVCSSLSTNPVPTPALGVAAGNTVSINAGVCGNTGATTVTWTPIVSFPSSISADTNADGTADAFNLAPATPLTTSDETLTLFVSEALTGVFPILVGVSDSAGTRAAAVVNVTLAIPDAAALNLDVSATRIQVNTGTGIALHSRRTSGVSDPTGPATADTFLYTWRVFNAGGTEETATFTPASGTLNDNEQIDWTVTGLATPGTYRFEATVSDPFNFFATSTATVLVADVLSLDVRSATNAYVVPPGTAVSLVFDRTGGVGDFDYAFSSDGPGANTGSFDASSPASSEADDRTVTWTAPGAGAGVAGSYRVDVTVTDSLGNTATDSVWLLVQADQPLAVDVRSNTNDYLAAPSEAMTLNLDRTGGVGPFSYAFSEDGPGACAGAFGVTSPVGAADDTTLTWTAPAASAACRGTYRIDVTVTDSLGATATDSAWFRVDADNALSLDLRSNDNNYIVQPAGSVTLNLDRTGGVANFTYALSQDGPGANAGAFGSVLPANPTSDDSTVTWTAPAAAAGVEGTYRINATVTDALGQTFTDSLWITVQAASPLSLDIRSTDNNYIVAPGATQNLRFDVTGGVAPYTYSFGQDGPGANAGVFDPVTDVSGQAGDLFVDWTAPAAAVGVEGTYRIQTVVTDALGHTFTDSLDLRVQAAELLSLDVRPNDTAADPYIVQPGGTVNLRFDVSGGETPYSYAYGQDGPGANAGVFTPASPQAGQAGDLFVDWDAPAAAAGVGGTYRIQVVVTDALGNTFTDSVSIIVQSADVLSLDVRSNDNSYIVAPGGSVTLNLDRTGGTADFTYSVADDGPGANVGVFGSILPANPTPDDATVTWTAPAAAAGVDGTYRIDATVTDALGDAFTDSLWITVQATSDLSLDVRSTDNNYFVIPGGTQNLRFDVTGGVGPYSYSFGQDGPGANAGVFVPPSDVSGEAGDLFVDWTAPAAAVGVAGSYRIQVVVTDTLGDTFTDSVVLFVQSAEVLSMDVRSDNYVLVEASADIGTLTYDVTGGTGDYTYAYQLLDNAGGVVVGQDSYFAGNSPQTVVGDLAVSLDPLGEDGAGGGNDLAAGFYTVVVTVTDALGDTFTDSVAIEVQ